jgi:PhnB protein
LLYEDGAAAMDFIRDAFGFEDELRTYSPEGRMWHGELRLGDGVVYVGEPGNGYQSPNRLGHRSVGIHVYVDDVDAHYERARAAGAEVKEPPSDRPYGDRSYSAHDLEGQLWYFSTHVRDVAPEEWARTTP